MCGESNQKDTSVEGYWNVLKGAFLEAADRICGWTKGPVRHRVTLWWNDDVSTGVRDEHLNTDCMG